MRRSGSRVAKHAFQIEFTISLVDFYISALRFSETFSRKFSKLVDRIGYGSLMRNVLETFRQLFSDGA